MDAHNKFISEKSVRNFSGEMQIKPRFCNVRYYFSRFLMAFCYCKNPSYCSIKFYQHRSRSFFPKKEDNKRFITPTTFSLHGECKLDSSGKRLISL